MNPPVMLIPKQRKIFFNEVLKLGKNKILIFISHRFSTVRRADKILLLDEGTIAEQGSHESLMKQKKNMRDCLIFRPKVINDN